LRVGEVLQVSSLVGSHNGTEVEPTGDFQTDVFAFVHKGSTEPPNETELSHCRPVPTDKLWRALVYSQLRKGAWLPRSFTLLNQTPLNCLITTASPPAVAGEYFRSWLQRLVKSF